jgi:hypothetical protein
MSHVNGASGESGSPDKVKEAAEILQKAEQESLQAFQKAYEELAIRTGWAHVAVPKPGLRPDGTFVIEAELRYGKVKKQQPE